MPIMSRISSRAMAIQPEMLGANQEKSKVTPKCGVIASIFFGGLLSISRSFVQSAPVFSWGGATSIDSIDSIDVCTTSNIDFLQEWVADIVVLLLVFLSLSPADIICKAVAIESDPRKNAPYQIKKNGEK